MRKTRARLLGATIVAAALALPASAAAHPAVYEVERKALTESEAAACNYATAPAGSGDCLDSIPGPQRYVVVNHNIPVAYDETNGLDAADGGVINFPRFPGAFRKTIPTAAEWLTVEPPRTGVQPHATCEAPETTDPEAIVGWQGAEPFYAYIPWQSISAGLDDDPAEWIGYVETLTGVDLAGMSAAQAEAACEAPALGGTYHPSDTPSKTSIASGLVAHEVEHAVAPLQAEIDGLLAERGSLQSQVEEWRAGNGRLEAELNAAKAAALAAQGAEATKVGQLAGEVSGLRKANQKKAKTIKKLRKQLRTARKHG